MCRATIIKTLFAALSLGLVSAAETVFLCEVHYDNFGPDAGKFGRVEGELSTRDESSSDYYQYLICACLHIICNFSVVRFFLVSLKTRVATSAL